MATITKIVFDFVSQLSWYSFLAMLQISKLSIVLMQAFRCRTPNCWCLQISLPGFSFCWEITLKAYYTLAILFEVFTFSHHFSVLTLVAKKYSLGFWVFGFFSTKVSNEKLCENEQNPKIWRTGQRVVRYLKLSLKHFSFKTWAINHWAIHIY